MQRWDTFIPNYEHWHDKSPTDHEFRAFSKQKDHKVYKVIKYIHIHIWNIVISSHNREDEPTGSSDDYYERYGHNVPW